ncbi:helix-turn-helix domain-containing protein [Streptomyces sp. NPDC047072]|uniref:helix-turn-helix domain-containing protein n=1 Tax=Streptomyces sp. NPDC047072 TaxID=3154809 RepID=UPI0033C51901
MRELAGRLSALDPDAGDAVRVITYFDELAEGRAGLETLVRGAAVLAGCPARLADATRRVRIRVEADGRRADTSTPPDPGWPSVPVAAGGASVLWLERAADSADVATRAGAMAGPPGAAHAGPTPGSPGAAHAEPIPGSPGAADAGLAAGSSSVVDAVILERAAAALRQVLDRTRGRAPAADDPAAVETVLDADAPERARLRAAGQLGLDTNDPATRACALAPFGGPPRVVAAVADGRPSPTVPTAVRLGVGSAVPVLELPRSFRSARTALRFTAEGTAQDPGRRVVHADDLGDVALLADLVTPGSVPPPDARAVDAAAADAPWMLVTLHAVATTSSLRAAATEANVHHSTLHDRLARAETLLGWPLRTAEGRLRLYFALTVRHLTRG